MDIGDYIAMKINGEEVSLRDLLRAAKLSGRLEFLNELTVAALVRQAAQQKGIPVSDEELQHAANDFRVAHALYKAEDLNRWLSDAHLTIEDWESVLIEQISARKLREVLVNGKVESYFAQNKPSFDVALISHLVVDDKGVAEELFVQLVEDGADFHALAREYSIDASTKLASGFVGPVKRNELDATVEAAVFSAQTGQIVGPFKTSRGWRLIKVERLRLASLEGSVRESIKSQLFELWLAEQYRAADISTPLLQEF